MHKKYIFIGNRFGILESMLEEGLNVILILVVKNSHLEQELDEKKIKYTKIKDFNFLIRKIEETNFDRLISNGCPYILPVSKIRKRGQEFINIHPSLLPDLRGKNPINGSILYDREAGATCHLMDDKVDNGSIISQIRIGKINNLGLLYKLSFLAEVKSFWNAEKRNFKSYKRNRSVKSDMYYTRKEKDMLVNFNVMPSEIVRIVKSFGIEGQWAYFYYGKIKIKVVDAEIIENKFLSLSMEKFGDQEVVFIFQNSILLKTNNKALLLKLLDRDILNSCKFKIGDRLG